MSKRKAFFAVALVVLLGAVLWGPIVSHVEQAKYTVIEKSGDIEIRDYSAMIVAEVSVAGERHEAIRQGFRIIADYIFGRNERAQSIAMTAPVMQKIEGDAWKVYFVMPAQYTIDSLPKPNTAEVKLQNISGKRFVVLRFSGTSSKQNLSSHTDALMKYVEERKMPIENKTPVYAFYNPPWTLPFLRRNEVMVELKKD